VSGFLRERGAVIVDADQLAREVVAVGTPGLGAVVAEFGAGVLLPDGSLDRPALGQRVFGDDGARRTLEGIVHPLVGQRAGELIAAAPADAVVVHDVPLLVEKQMGAAYHLVVVVGADTDTRLARLVGIRGMTEADARARIGAQAEDTARRAAADVWLDNSGDIAELRDAVDALWVTRLVPYEENLRLRRPAPCRGGVPGPYDPAWPVQAARIGARVLLAAGPAVGAVEHIGPTSVPGGAAEDVLDLRLSLAPGADPESVRPALEEAGFPRLADSGGSVHGAADPGRPARVHVERSDDRATGAS
jgi:dephospho-CoA kinase